MAALGERFVKRGLAVGWGTQTEQYLRGCFQLIRKIQDKYTHEFFHS